MDGPEIPPEEDLAFGNQEAVPSAEEIEAAWYRALVTATRFRFIVSAVLTLLAITVGSTILPGVPLAAFLALLAWVAFSTLVLSWLNEHTSRQRLEQNWYFRLGVFVSVLTVTLATYIVGEVAGDFYLVYFIPLISAGVYFGLTGALLTAAAGGVSYFLLAYLAVPLTPALLHTLAIRIGYMFLLGSAIGLLTEGQRYLLHGLRQAYDHALRLALLDPLTGIHNRRYLASRLEEEIARQRRTGASVALLALDMDSFKSYNDDHGHLEGDRALRAVARLLTATTRDTDIVGRFGGDEFAAILPDTSATQALALARRIRQQAAEHFRALPDGALLSVTIGVAACPENAQTARELFASADQALYRAKRNGGNGVAPHEDPEPEPETEPSPG